MPARKEYNAEGLKHCVRCGTWKDPIKDFSASKKRLDGRDCYCRACHKEYSYLNRDTIRERSRENRKKYYQENKEYYRDYVLANKERYRENRRKRNLRRYKINDKGLIRHLTTDDKYEIFNKQHGCCAICKCSLVFEDRNTHIDHSEKTGLVRAILCHHCNTGIGSFKESTIILDAAIMYLIAHNEIGYGNVG